MIRIVIVTLLVYWAVGLILAALFAKLRKHYDDDFLAFWGAGILYWVLYVLCFPIRAWDSYSKNRQQYTEHGISWWQYLLGRRIRTSSMNPIARRIWKGKSNDDGGSK